MDDLAGDLLFMKDFNIDMCGMGPYIEHADTPLIEYAGDSVPLSERFDLTLKMIAILRIMMKDINIVAATALQAIDPVGREKAVNDRRQHNYAEHHSRKIPRQLQTL